MLAELRDDLRGRILRGGHRVERRDQELDAETQVAETIAGAGAALGVGGDREVGPFGRHQGVESPDDLLELRLAFLVELHVPRDSGMIRHAIACNGMDLDRPDDSRDGHAERGEPLAVGADDESANGER